MKIYIQNTVIFMPLIRRARQEDKTQFSGAQARCPAKAKSQAFEGCDLLQQLRK
jgi:hypothetical protein